MDKNNWYAFKRRWSYHWDHLSFPVFILLTVFIVWYFQDEISEIVESKLGYGKLLTTILILEFAILGILMLIGAALKAYKEEKDESKPQITKITRDRKDRIKVLMLEYEELLNEILHRRRNTWLIHSILLASTFIISFGTYNSRLQRYSYLASLILVIFSWFFQLTAQHVNRFCWDRRHEIENYLGIKGPKERLEKLKKTKLYQIRHRLWPALWFVLGTLYFILFLASIFWQSR